MNHPFFRIRNLSWQPVLLGSLLALADALGAAAAPGAALAGAETPSAAAHTLSGLISLALSHSADLKASSHDVDAAAARARAAAAVGQPRFSLEGGLTHFSDDQRLMAARTNGEAGVFGPEVAAIELVARVPLYTGGRLSAEEQAAASLQSASAQRLARTQADLVLNVGSLYHGLLAQRALLAALAQDVATLRAQAQRVQAMVAGGKAAALESMRIDVRLAELEQRRLRESLTERTLEQSLLNLTGGGRGPLLLQAAGAPPLPASTPLQLLQEQALRQRADLATARLEWQAQTARVDAARAATGPSVNLLAAVGERALLRATEPTNGQARDHAAWRVGLSFDWTFADGGLRDARTDEESARLAAQGERLQRLTQQIELDVEQAVAALDSALQRIEGTAQAVVLARRTLDIETEKFTLGRGTNFDVLDAQAALSDLQALSIRALADAHMAQARLRWALGENL